MTIVGRPGGSGLVDRADFAVVVEGQDRHLAVVVSETERRLVAVEPLAPHLHPADRAEALALDGAHDLGRPVAVAHAYVLDHPDAGPEDIARLGRDGDHRWLPRRSKHLNDAPPPSARAYPR